MSERPPPLPWEYDDDEVTALSEDTRRQRAALVPTETTGEDHVHRMHLLQHGLDELALRIRELEELPMVKGEAAWQRSYALADLVERYEELERKIKRVRMYLNRPATLDIAMTTEDGLGVLRRSEASPRGGLNPNGDAGSTSDLIADEDSDGRPRFGSLEVSSPRDPTVVPAPSRASVPPATRGGSPHSQAPTAPVARDQDFSDSQPRGVLRRRGEGRGFEHLVRQTTRRVVEWALKEDGDEST